MHETEDIVIKSASIDKNMIPGIKWMNRFDHVYTLFCCEGDDKPKSPYILFFCWDQHELLRIMDSVGLLIGWKPRWAGLEIDNFQGMIRYNLIFNDKKDFDSWSRHVSGEPPAWMDQDKPPEKE